MPTKAQTQFQPPPEPPRKRDPAHHSGEDVSGPIIVILAVIAFVLAASFLYNLEEALNSDLPTMSETVPSRAPAAPPSNS